MLQPFARFGIEELLRRIMRRDEPLNKTQILQILYPIYKALRDETGVRLKKELTGSGSGNNGGGQYGSHIMGIAQHYKSLDKEVDPQSVDTS